MRSTLQEWTSFMRRWSFPILFLLTGLLLATTVAPAMAPRVTDLAATPPATLHPLARGKPDRTGYIKGIYVSYAALSHADYLHHIQSLLEDTEINAVVLDFKSDQGLLSFPCQIPLAREIGAAQAPAIRDPVAFLTWFQQRNIYTIARIVTFKDNLLAQARPDWAITDATTGRVWRDHEGMGWIDPFSQAAWDYNTALAQEAANLGFNEVQFDYIRFPTDGSVGAARYAQPNTQENRIAAITDLLDRTRQALQPLGVKLSVDTFGYASWVPDDLGIGQQIEALAPHVDVLAPMLYPSTFDAGLPGQAAQYRNAIAYPYEIIQQSTQRTLARAQPVNPSLVVRPWLQDFRDYAFDGRTYTPAEIRRQMEGAQAAGARGWLLWDPSVRYTRAALVSAQPSYEPNPHGKVLVVAYDNFVSAETPGATSPTSLRADLEQLLAAGFYPINLRDLTEGKLRTVPAGKRPVALTFDNATLDQFRLQADGAVEPTCAVGVLWAMHADHPADWPLRATFFLPAASDQGTAAIFGTADLAAAKLQLLITWGLEVGLALPETTTAAMVRDSATQTAAQLATWLPGYEIATIALPATIAAAHPPADATLSWTPITGAVTAHEGLAPAPDTSAFDPYSIPRIPSRDLPRWLQRAGQSGVHYVSGGE